MTHVKKYRRMESSLDRNSIDNTVADLQLSEYMIVFCAETWFLFWDRIY